MSDLDTFGPLIIDDEVGAAVQSTLTEWYPTYLAMLSRNLPDLGQLPAPLSYVQTSDPNHFAEEASPSVVIAIPGTIGRPRRDALNYRAFYDVRIIVYVQSTSRSNTEKLSRRYATATRLIMTHKPSLGNFAEGTDWLGTSYGIRVADLDQRTKGSCENRFSVDVRDVVQAFAGPSSPITTVPPSPPTVTSVKTTLLPHSP